MLAANDGVVGLAPNTLIFWEPAPEDDEMAVFIGGDSRVFGACMPLYAALLNGRREAA